MQNTSGAALAGAAVSVLDNTGAVVFSGVTDANGQVTGIPIVTTIYSQLGDDPTAITTDACGPFQLQVSLAGYATSNQQITLAQSQTVVVQLEGGMSSPPTVQSIVINDGSAQRSRVNSVTVTFSTVVVMDPGDFEVLQTGTGGGLVTVAVASVVQNNKTVATLTFSGGFTEYNSLKDGQYQLTIYGDKVYDSATLTNLDGDGDGQPGGNRVFGAQPADDFFRLFGDSNGDGYVDNLDLIQFRQSYLTNADYEWYFDFNGDGYVDSFDLLESQVA